MKIAFVDGPWPGFGHRTQRWPHKNLRGNINPPPLFQMYAASVAMQKGFEVKIWDAPAQQLPLEQLLKEVADFAPEMIVVNVSTPSFDHDLDLIRTLKQRLSSVIVTVGPHVTALAQSVMSEHREIDIVALGEYEYTISEIASSLDKLSAVKGIVFRKGDKLMKTETRELLKDIDELPYPAWDAIDIHLYRESQFPASKRPIATVMTSRGCNHHCTFCLYPQVMFNNKLRLRDLSMAIEEIRWLKDRFGVRFIYLEDDNFTASWKRVEEFCAMLIKERVNISWGCLSRTDGVTKERLSLLKESGCYLIKYGVESGSQQLLDNVNKHNTLDAIAKAFDLTKEMGIMTHATVMTGAPGENLQTISETRKFIRRLAPDSVQFSVCTPFPGTSFFDECKKNNWLNYERWEDFDGNCGGVLDYPGLSKQEIKRAVRDSYRNYYFSFPYIRQRLTRTFRGPDRLSQISRNFYLIKRLAKLEI
jgi:anaerobic magnesium-protoporphyrin IX monomethyl ester cyclase